MSSFIKEYSTTSELQDDIDAKIKDVEQRITEYSKKIGEKLREDKLSVHSTLPTSQPPCPHICSLYLHL